MTVDDYIREKKMEVGKQMIKLELEKRPIEELVLIYDCCKEILRKRA